MKGKLKNLFAPKFSEYSAFLHAWETIRESTKILIEGDQNAFGKSFEQFVKSQPANDAPLGSIKENGLAQVKAMQTLMESTNSKTTDFHDLLILNDQYSKSIATLNDLKSAEKKAKSQEETANTNLEKAKAKGQPADISKKEQAAAHAHSKTESAVKAVEDYQLKHEAAAAKYRQDFIERLLEILSDIVAQKIGEINELIPIAQELASAGSQIHEYDDKSTAKLEETLEEYNKITID